MRHMVSYGQFKRRRAGAKILLVLSGFIASLLVCTLFLLGEIFGFWNMVTHQPKIEIKPQTIHLDNMEPGAVEHIFFELENRGNAKVNIVGERATCTCASSLNLPLTVEPNRSAKIEVRVSLPLHRSQYDESILFMVATPKKLELIPVRITAFVPHPLPKPEEQDQQSDISSGQ